MKILHLLYWRATVDAVRRFDQAVELAQAAFHVSDQHRRRARELETLAATIGAAIGSRHE